MKRMPNGGYTIIEVMIFLVISSALLGSTTLMLSGRQERTRFTNSVESFEQKFKDILNDVSTGYYPTDESFQCRLDGGGDIDFLPAGAAGQGSNTGCLFLGRAIQLDVSTEYDTYTVVGAQTATKLSDSQAQLLAAGGNPGIKTENVLDADLQIVKVVSQTDPSRSVKGIALISQFSQVSTVDNKLTGNAAQVTLYEVLNNFQLNVTDPNSMRTADKGVVLCLQQGGISGNGRKAAIIIGGNGQQLSTETKIDEWPPGLGC